MPRKTLGQEEFGRNRRPRNNLEELAAVISWNDVEVCLADISNNRLGQVAWPPLSLFKALLLGYLYDLSDVKLAEALDDRASFRLFCGFSRTEPVPERTAFVRFRKQLIFHGLEDKLFASITAQLRAKHITVKNGTMIDATIEDSVSKKDPEAKWLKHEGKRLRYGYKAHITADQDTALIETVTTTTANDHDSIPGATIIPDDPGDVYADSAYRGAPFEKAVTDKGGRARVILIGVYAKARTKTPEEADALMEEINEPIRKVRAGIEKIFGTMKRSYGLRRMRYWGKAKAHLQNIFTSIAYNMKRAFNLSRQAT